MKTIGIGAKCAICGSTIHSGESYLSGWGEDNDSVHHVCNLRRLGLAQSNFSPFPDLLKKAQEI